jgi:glycosyltransferase involved in cell wall biosynthesis
MKICFLIEDFYPVMHGATTQLLQLAKRLTKRGSTVTVITRRVSKEHLRREEKDGYDIVRVMPAIGMHRLGKYLMIPPALFALRGLRNNYDLIVVCDLKALGIPGIVAARCLGKRCILRAESCGELDGSYALNEMTSPIAAFLVTRALSLRNWVLLRADAYLSISRPIYREFIACGVPPDKIKTIPNGVDVTRFATASPARKAALRKSMNLPLHDLFVYTGRLAQGKGLQILLNVWQKLAGRRPDAHLLLVGSGQGYASSCEAELKQFVVQNHLLDRVTFTGSVDNVEDYLQAADFFVLPSQNESFGLSLLEGMACGLPCIATAVGGMAEIVDDGVDGRLVPYGDMDSLLEAMEQFLVEPEHAAAFGRAARLKVEAKYNLDEIAERYLTQLS